MTTERKNLGFLVTVTVKDGPRHWRETSSITSWSWSDYGNLFIV